MLILEQIMGATTLRMMTPSITISSAMLKKMTLNADCRYVKCQYSMLGVAMKPIRLSVITLSVVMLTVIAANTSFASVKSSYDKLTMKMEIVS